MALSFAIVLLSCVVCIHAQSIKGLGVSGGRGPKGGIGDADHPVLKAQSFITDALIPLRLKTTRQLAVGVPPRLVKGNEGLQICPPPLTVTVDSSAKGARQEMVGFGHSWTDSTVTTFQSLEADVLDQVMWDLFSPEANNLGFMRHTIGASDLSDGFYSYTDNGPSFNEGEPDLNLTTFGLGRNGTAMAKMIAHMGNYKGDVFLYGAPWSFPGWTKHNGLLIAPRLGKNVLNNSFDTQYIPQMVDYFTRYIDTYQRDYGVKINGLSLMNEPLNYQGRHTLKMSDFRRLTFVQVAIQRCSWIRRTKLRFLQKVWVQP
jgi:glucosylceramidase